MAGTVSEHEKDRAGRHIVRDESEIVLRRLVRPVDVLEDHHLWQALGLAEHEPAKGVE